MRAGSVQHPGRRRTGLARHMRLAVEAALIFLIGASSGRAADRPEDLAFELAGKLTENVTAWLPRSASTPHYEIHSDLDAEHLEFYAKFFEDFTAWFQANYFDFDQTTPLRVCVFSNQTAFVDFSRKQGLPDTPFGYYLGPIANTAVINLDRGIGAATHELVHHFIMMGFPHGCPHWVNEGFCMFFEKFIAHYDEAGNLQITFGYFNDWRFVYAWNVIDQTTLADIVGYRLPNSAQAFILFLHHRQLLKLFMNDLRQSPHDRLGIDTLTSIYGGTGQLILRDWKRWMAEQEVDADMRLIQRSFVLTAPEWDAWWATNADRMYWDEERQIYRSRQSPAPSPIR